MNVNTPADQIAPTIGIRPNQGPARRLGALDILLLSAWCGLSAGWLEVGTRVLLKSILFTDRMYRMNRQFVWLVPLSNLLMFVVAGSFLALATRRWPRAAGWVSPRIVCTLTLLPALTVAIPQIYPWAWLLLAAGFAMRVTPLLERPSFRWRRWLILTFPCLLVLVAVVAGFVFGGDWVKEAREAARPLPAAGSPNILLIVLDTVRVDRLSMYGYPRPTTPNLEWLAKRGVRFDRARATAPWTLPSHASMFTGHLPHELGVSWKTALKTKFTTLAEYLASQGYATAGFVANTQYCSYDTGLDRGFAHYEDYAFDIEHLRPLRTAVLFELAWDGISNFGLAFNRSRYGSVLHWFLATDRKSADTVNREFVRWLLHRRERGRPFFAFLNYFDAHAPYLPPEGTRFRFGSGPRTVTDFMVLIELWNTIDKHKLSQHSIDLIQDSYDNCLAYLDERLGVLLAALRNGGVLDQTVVVITADHGEQMGEHGLFEHGESLYRPEIHMPLLVLLPSRQQPVVVRETVSLRDLPATVVDLAGLAATSPFPGRSLARLWRDPAPASSLAAGDRPVDGAISELSAPNPADPSRGRSPAIRGPLVSLAQDDYVYIRNQGDGTEELFHEREDPLELVNLAGSELMQPRLRRLRQYLDKMMADPTRAEP